MSHLVAITRSGELRTLLSASGGREYAKWQFDRLIHRGEVHASDVIAEVTQDEYDRLCDKARYRHQCLTAARKLGRRA